MTRTGNHQPGWLALALSDGVPRAAFIAALVVGTILNVINQGDAMIGGGDLNIAKILLTYCVPYCVATYGAVSAQRRFLRLTAKRPAGETE